MPKMAVFDPTTHPVTLGHVSIDPPTHLSMTYLLFMVGLWVNLCVFLWTPEKRSYQLWQQILNRTWNRIRQFTPKI